MSSQSQSNQGSSADICRRNGWSVGTILTGDEGFGPTVIQITAIGEECVLAKTLSHCWSVVAPDESEWDLSFRDWKEVPA